MEQNSRPTIFSKIGICNRSRVPSMTHFYMDHFVFWLISVILGNLVQGSISVAEAFSMHLPRLLRYGLI